MTMFYLLVEIIIPFILPFSIAVFLIGLSAWSCSFGIDCEFGKDCMLWATSMFIACFISFFILHLNCKEAQVSLESNRILSKPHQIQFTVYPKDSTIAVCNKGTTLEEALNRTGYNKSQYDKIEKVTCEDETYIYNKPYWELQIVKENK